MAEDDEIDILGDFSFNSCLAQNTQGIPSCSNREDTVHPQWLLDSTANNWYDNEDKLAGRRNEGHSRKLSGNNSKIRYTHKEHTTWSSAEKEMLKKEMAKHGRDVHKISLTLESKSKDEIQALIEAEYGIILDTPAFGLVKFEDVDNTPPVAQEEVILDETNSIINNITTASPTIPVIKKAARNNRNASRKIFTSSDLEPVTTMNPKKMFYGNKSIIKSAMIKTNVNIKTFKRKNKTRKKMGSHKVKQEEKINILHKHENVLNSPPKRQRKSSNLSDETTKSPKLQILLGSGQALPVSEGEQVIKLEKNKDECESDIEVDIDSDKEEVTQKTDSEEQRKSIPEEQQKVLSRKFEPMPKRNRKINLDGGGGYTIMHTENGDLYEIGEEPRKEPRAKKPVIQLYPCRVYNAEKPAPYSVSLHVSALVCADAHAHTSRAEVMGLLGGRLGARALAVRRYRAVRAAAHRTHCDMDPVSQAAAAEWLRGGGGGGGGGGGVEVVGWHHSHPSFPAAPSALDLREQRALQALGGARHTLALITAHHWPPGRSASLYRCLRVEETDEETDIPVGYQLNVKLVPDITADNLTDVLQELRTILLDSSEDSYQVNIAADICPHARLTYLEKLISSITQHMRSAGYEDGDPVIEQLMQGIRDTFR